MWTGTARASASATCRPTRRRAWRSAVQGGARPAPRCSSSIAAIRLLIFTGCRLSEILTLRWEHVDLGRGCLRLPDSKTGAKVVHLNGAAVAVLQSLAA